MPLTVPEVAYIKQCLWNGETQASIAERVGLTQVTISRIKNGLQYPNVAWPDGSTGPMPRDAEHLAHVKRLKNRPPKTAELIELLQTHIKRRQDRRRQALIAAPHIPTLSTFDEEAEARKVQETVAKIVHGEEPALDTDAMWDAFLGPTQAQKETVIIEGGSDPDVLEGQDPILRWPEIKERYPQNRMVIAASVTEDPVLQRAVVLALEQTSKAMHDSPSFPTFVAEVAEAIRPLYSLVSPAETEQSEQPAEPAEQQTEEQE